MSGATRIETKEKSLLDCTLQELEERFKDLSDDERERAVSKLWSDYRNKIAEA